MSLSEWFEQQYTLILYKHLLVKIIFHLQIYWQLISSKNSIVIAFIQLQFILYLFILNTVMDK